MIIGLAGAHRSGKSTLAQAISDRHGIAYYDGSFGRLAKTFGYNSVAAMSPFERITMQFAVLERFATEIREQGGSVITDRTPLDMLAYMLAEVGMHAGLDEGTAHGIVRYRDRCLALTRELFGAVLLLQPLPTYVVEDGKPSDDPAYQLHIQALIEGSIFALRHDVDVIPIDAMPLDARIRDAEIALRLPTKPSAFRANPTEPLGTVPESERNSGYSLGLEHPYIYGDRGRGYEIWHRHTGAIVWRDEGGTPVLARHRASDECHRRNGLDTRPSAEVLMDIDATP